MRRITTAADKLPKVTAISREEALAKLPEPTSAATHRAHSGNGIFWPVILQDGEAVGNWSVAGGKVQTEVFHPDVNLNQEALKA